MIKIVADCLVRHISDIPKCLPVYIVLVGVIFRVNIPYLSGCVRLVLMLMDVSGSVHLALQLRGKLSINTSDVWESCERRYIESGLWECRAGLDHVVSIMSGNCRNIYRNEKCA